jgi:hypothetical protein
VEFNPDDASWYLEGVDYPASKEDLITAARDNDAPEGLIGLLGEAMRILDPRTAIPIHYNDYTAFKSRLDEFQRAVIDAGLQDRVHYLMHGDTYSFRVPDAR